MGTLNTNSNIKLFNESFEGPDTSLWSGRISVFRELPEPKNDFLRMLDEEDNDEIAHDREDIPVKDRYETKEISCIAYVRHKLIAPVCMCSDVHVWSDFLKVYK